MSPKRTRLEVYLAMVADNLDVGQEDVQILAGNHVSVTTDGAGDYTVAVSTAHATTAEMEAGTQTARRLMSPKNIDEAIQALAIAAVKPPVLFLYGAGQDDANQPEFFPRRDLLQTEDDNVSVVKFNPTPQRKLNGATDDMIAFVDTADLPAGLDPPVYDATNFPEGVGDDVLFGLTAGTWDMLYRGNTSILNDNDLICRLCKVNNDAGASFDAGSNMYGIAVTDDRIITLNVNGAIQFFTHAGVEQTGESFDVGVGTFLGLAVTDDRIITLQNNGTIRFFTHAGAEQTGESFDTSSNNFNRGLAVTDDRIITIQLDGTIQSFTHTGTKQDSESFDAGSGNLFEDVTVTDDRIITLQNNGQIKFFNRAGVGQESENFDVGSQSNFSGIVKTDAYFFVIRVTGEIIGFDQQNNPESYDDDNILGEAIGVTAEENPDLRGLLRGMPFEIRRDFVEVAAADRFYISFDRFNEMTNNNVGGYMQLTRVA